MYRFKRQNYTKGTLGNRFLEASVDIPKQEPKAKSRRTEAEMLADGFNQLLNIGTNIYSSKPVKNSIFDICTNIYSNKPIVNKFMKLGTDVYTTKKVKVKEHIEEKKQLGKAKTAIKKSTPIIEFDLTKMKDRDYFYKELPDVLYSILDSIELDKDKWCILYDYGSGWKGKPLNTVAEKAFRDQIEHELEQNSYDYQFDEHDYDFFPYG